MLNSTTPNTTVSVSVATLQAVADAAQLSYGLLNQLIDRDALVELAPHLQTQVQTQMQAGQSRIPPGVADFAAYHARRAGVPR